MALRFVPPQPSDVGVIAAMLNRVYAPLVESYPRIWGREQVGWEEFDRQVFQNLDSVGACTFLTWLNDRLIGFGSYDPRQKPHLGIIGHNCILLEFRGQKHGIAQVHEILRRFQSMGIQTARVSTADHAFFVPAQRMYLACGFQEVCRIPWPSDPRQCIIEYTYEL